MKLVTRLSMQSLVHLFRLTGLPKELSAQNRNRAAVESNLVVQIPGSASACLRSSSRMTMALLRAPFWGDSSKAGAWHTAEALNVFT
jgi:hypothetical protein